MRLPVNESACPVQMVKNGVFHFSARHGMIVHPPHETIQDHIYRYTL
jgi:hypothetical protein